MYVKKLTDIEFVKLIVDKELEIVNAPVRYNDLIADKEGIYKHWYQDFAFDDIKQYIEWKEFYYDHFYDWKPKRIKDIDRHFSWFALQYGLKYNFSYDELREYEQQFTKINRNIRKRNS